MRYVCSQHVKLGDFPSSYFLLIWYIIFLDTGKEQTHIISVTRCFYREGNIGDGEIGQ